MGSARLPPDPEESIAALRLSHPWPAERPADPVPLSGWLGEGNKRLLRRAIAEVRPRVIVELGSWLGLSARFLAEAAPDATILCVDTWEGGEEHHRSSQFRPVLGRLHGSFIAHLWPHRDRVVPVRGRSWDGMQAIHDHGVAADLVYIDASHETPDVLRDLETARRLFPDAVLTGDDWSWPSVRRAVIPFARRHRMRVVRDGNAYLLAANAAPGRLHYAALRAGTVWKGVDRAAVWPLVRRIRRRRH